jgi:hypothetical protein
MEELKENSSYKEFAYRMAKSPFLPSRVNAMRALRQLGGMGDGRAVVLLKEATKDVDPLVRKGAEAALRLATGSGADR